VPCGRTTGYVARRIAWHVLEHAGELQDRADSRGGRCRVHATHERVSAAPVHMSISARAKRRIGRGNLPMNDTYRYINSLPSLDAEYRFGEPRLYLAPHELARLTILRSKLGDTRVERAAERIQLVDASRGHA